MKEPGEKQPDPLETSRRQFLTGRSLTQGGERAVDSLLPESEDTQSSTQAHAGYLLEVSRDAMACEFQVLLNATHNRDAIESAIGALDLVESLDQRLSVFQ